MKLIIWKKNILSLLKLFDFKLVKVKVILLVLFLLAGYQTYFYINNTNNSIEAMQTKDFVNYEEEKLSLEESKKELESIKGLKINNQRKEEFKIINNVSIRGDKNKIIDVINLLEDYEILNYELISELNSLKLSMDISN